MAGDLYTAPGIISLSLADRSDICDTCGKWPLARNSDSRAVVDRQLDREYTTDNFPQAEERPAQ